MSSVDLLGNAIVFISFWRRLNLCVKLKMFHFKKKSCHFWNINFIFSFIIFPRKIVSHSTMGIQKFLHYSVKLENLISWQYSEFIH